MLVASPYVQLLLTQRTIAGDVARSGWWLALYETGASWAQLAQIANLLRGAVNPLTTQGVTGATVVIRYQANDDPAPVFGPYQDLDDQVRLTLRGGSGLRYLAGIRAPRGDGSGLQNSSIFLPDGEALNLGDSRVGALLTLLANPQPWTPPDYGPYCGAFGVQDGPIPAPAMGLFERITDGRRFFRMRRR